MAGWRDTATKTVIPYIARRYPLIVSGEKHGGRAVRNVVKIELRQAASDREGFAKQFFREQP
jgi:hypothetical protein